MRVDGLDLFIGFVLSLADFVLARLDARNVVRRSEVLLPRARIDANNTFCRLVCGRRDFGKFCIVALPNGCVGSLGLLRCLGALGEFAPIQFCEMFCPLLKSFFKMFVGVHTLEFDAT